MPIVAYLTTTTTLRGLTGLSSCNNRWWIVIIMRNAVVGHVSEGVVAKTRPRKMGHQNMRFRAKSWVTDSFSISYLLYLRNKNIA
jgi:hypothetical protein